MSLKFFIAAVLVTWLTFLTPSEAVGYQDGDDLLVPLIQDSGKLLLCQGVDDFLAYQDGDDLLLAYQDGDDLLLAYQDGDDLLIAYQDGDDLLSIEDGEDLLAQLIVFCQDSKLGQ